MLNLYLDSVEIRSVPACHTPFRREMVHGFADNEFKDLLEQVRSNTLTDEALQTFCDRFGYLTANVNEPAHQIGGFEVSKTLIILNFKESSKETLTHYHSVMGLLDNFDLNGPIPDNTLFTPISYSGYMLINGVQSMQAETVDFYSTNRGFDDPLVCIKPGYLLDKSLMDKMIAGKYYDPNLVETLCNLSPINFSLQKNSSPSIYLQNVIKAALNAREYVYTHTHLSDDPTLGIQDCARYLLGSDSHSYANPVLFFFDEGFDGGPTIGKLREWFTNFDDVIQLVVSPQRNYLETTKPLGSYDIGETMAQELTINAMVEMSKEGLRELSLKSNPLNTQWDVTHVASKSVHNKNIEEKGQKISDRLYKQFFTKYAELMCNNHPIVELMFNAAGISEIKIYPPHEDVKKEEIKGFVFPTYNMPAWSPMMMTEHRAHCFAEHLYSYVDMLIHE